MYSHYLYSLFVRICGSIVCRHISLFQEHCFRMLQDLEQSDCPDVLEIIQVFINHNKILPEITPFL